MKISSLILILSTICLVSGISFWKNLEQYCVVTSAGKSWMFEVARTPEEHTRGLMEKKYLCGNCGMLFVFDREEERVFWMKNTFIPLDIYFYNAGGKLVDTARNMRPENETGGKPMVFTSSPAQFVLEVNSGAFFDTSSIPESCRKKG